MKRPWDINHLLPVNQGSIKRSRALGLSSGSHRSIFLTNFRNISLLSPSRYTSESSSEVSGIPLDPIHRPGINISAAEQESLSDNIRIYLSCPSTSDYWNICEETRLVKGRSSLSSPREVDHPNAGRRALCRQRDGGPQRDPRSRALD